MVLKVANSVTEFVAVNRSGRTGIIRLDRPQKKNALATQMIAELYEAVSEFSSDESLRVIVLTGTGDTFCAGADVGEFLSRSDNPVEKITYGYQKQLHELYTAIETASIPVIAGVNGLANGGGAELMLACDIRIGKPSARLALGEINFGLIPPFNRLSRELSPSRVRELCFTGWELTADEADSANVFNTVVDSDQFHPTIDEYTHELESKSRHALQRTKEAMWHSKRRDIYADIQHRRVLESVCFSHPDFREKVEEFR